MLVVDDSVVMRLAIQRAIGISGLAVEYCMTAEHGKAALSLLKDQKINLMLVDLNMPDMSGGDLIRCLRDQPAKNAIPFIAISGDATATRMQEMLDLGALAYIPKPFTPATLRLEMAKASEHMYVCN